MQRQTFSVCLFFYLIFYEKRTIFDFVEILIARKRRMATNVRNYTDDEILERAANAEGFKGWTRGAFEILVRSNEDEFNKFDDKFYSYWSHGNGINIDFVMVCTGTTNAGAQGLLSYTNHLGCAVLKSDIWVYNSHVFGPHNQREPEAYIQARDNRFVPFPYYRDSNKNRKAEEIGKIYYDRIGANMHGAGKQISINIDGWSTACLVRNNREQYKKWLAYLKGKGKPPVNTIILKEW